MLVQASAKVGGEIYDRVDDKFTRAIIRSNGEPGAIGSAQNEFASHHLLPPADLLVNPRSLQLNISVFVLDDQISVLQCKVPSPLKLHLGRSGIRTGSYLEVIFQMSLVPVENEIDSGIDVFRNSPARTGARQLAILPDRCR